MRASFGAGALAATLSLAPVLAVSAQDAARYVGVGVIVGQNHTNFTGSGSYRMANRTSFMAGAMADFHLGETFSLRPELYLASKGARLRDDEDNVGEVANRLHYVQLPLMVQFRTPRGTLFHPRFFGGPALGVLLNCKLANQSCDNIDAFDGQSVDFSLVIGAEISLAGIGLGVRHEAGLAPVGRPTAAGKVYNSTLSVTLRYMINVRRLLS